MTKWEYLAEDYNSPYFRNYIWTKCFVIYEDVLNIPRLIVGMIAKKGNAKYIGNIERWKMCHEALKKKALADYTYVDKLIDKTNKLGEEFNKWTKDSIINKDLTKLSGKELMELLEQFVDKQATIYAYGVAIPVLDFQNFSYVEGNLRKYLKENLSEEEYKKAYEVFTAPAYNSFHQNQEEDLLKLMEEFYSEEWKKNILEKNVDYIKQKYPEFYKKIQEHTKKYCWVYYVYTGPAYTEENFLEFIKNYLKKGIKPKNKLIELKQRKENIENAKQEYIKRLQPDKFNKTILNLGGKLVWAKPRRKDYQSKSYYHLEKLQKEIGKRLDLTLNEIRYAPLYVLEDALINGTKANKEIIKEVYECHACIPDENGEVITLHGKDAEEFYKNIEEAKDDNIEQKSELKGVCACRGNAKGAVKIINQPKDMDKMRDGDILVSTATTPSIVLAMKKASAIITDEGGLTCHAAIVSRELNIPCVVGTKIATKVLKDGDLVEVDANNGVVKKLGQI